MRACATALLSLPYSQQQPPALFSRAGPFAIDRSKAPAASHTEPLPVGGPPGERERDSRRSTDVQIRKLQGAPGQSERRQNSWAGQISAEPAVVEEEWPALLDVSDVAPQPRHLCPSLSVPCRLLPPLPYRLLASLYPQCTRTRTHTQSLVCTDESAPSGVRWSLPNC